MAILDINHLIHESVMKSMADTPLDEITTKEAFLNSIVEEVKKFETKVTLPILQEAFSEVFENKDHIKFLQEKFTENEIFIEGFNIEESDDSQNPYSTAIGLIASGVGAKKYLISNAK